MCSWSSEIGEGGFEAEVGRLAMCLLDAAEHLGGWIAVERIGRGGCLLTATIAILLWTRRVDVDVGTPSCPYEPSYDELGRAQAYLSIAKSEGVLTWGATGSGR